MRQDKEIKELIISEMTQSGTLYCEGNCTFISPGIQDNDVYNAFFARMGKVISEEIWEPFGLAKANDNPTTRIIEDGINRGYDIIRSICKDMGLRTPNEEKSKELLYENLNERYKKEQ